MTGTRKTTRYQKIEVEYQNASWKKMKQTFTGLTAESHERALAAMQSCQIRVI